MDICCDKLLRYEYEQIKIFINNNIDTIESILTPIIIVVVYANMEKIILFRGKL